MSKLTVHGAKAASAATAKSDIVVVPLFKNEDLSTSASEVNAAAGMCCSEQSPLVMQMQS